MPFLFEVIKKAIDLRIMQLLHDRSCLFSGNGFGELGSVLSIQMFVEQLIRRRLKVQVAVFVTASAWSAATHCMCLNRTQWVAEKAAFSLYFILFRSEHSLVVGVI